jgi:poly-gamma-glutamate synthesis protein (capsule biosynthesis protein)
MHRCFFVIALSFGLALYFTHPPLATAKNQQVILIATGDIIPARSVNSAMSRRHDFRYPFRKTAKLLKSADLLLINLEAPLIENCPVTDEGMIFCGSPRFIEGLNFVEVSVANLANNHSGNYGNEGLEATRKLLNTHGIKVTGMGQAAILQRNGLRFGFLGYNDVGSNEGLNLAAAEPGLIKKQISKLRPKVDYVVVSFHWGEEYTATPNQRQKELAHLAIDHGADLIVGNHPHWIQSKEKYKGKLINYALGNFIFDQMWSTETRQGLVAKYVFNSRRLVKTTYFPIIIENYAQPRLLKGSQTPSID